MRQFQRYIGIDYSGAGKPDAPLSGLQVFVASANEAAQQVLPPQSRRKNWSRKAVAEWLLAALREGQPTIVGIDHGFSFPTEYFERFDLEKSWDVFLRDFVGRWPTRTEPVGQILKAHRASGEHFTGEQEWRRPPELRTKGLIGGGAKSVFDFTRRPGNVSFSTHAGIPWLHFLRLELEVGFNHPVHWWPFDGWQPPANTHVIVEAYPALYTKGLTDKPQGTDRDPYDAASIADWLRRQDANESLNSYFTPDMTEAERQAGRYEGWILGVR